VLDNNRNSVLHWAVEARNAVAISMLLEKNSPLDIANDKVKFYSLCILLILNCTSIIFVSFI